MTATWTLVHRAEVGGDSSYVFVGAQEGWRYDAETGLEVRDLGLEESSGGGIGALHLRNSSSTTIEVPTRKAAAARFLLVLVDRIEVVQPGAPNAALHERGFAYLPPATDLTLLVPPGSEVLEISAPARALELGDDDSGTLPALPIYAEDGATEWELGGLRSFFRYRHLPTADITDDLVRLQLSEAIAPCPAGGTGFHHHTSSQIFYVLSGWVDLAMEGVGHVRAVTGDAVCIPGGAHARHNVTDFSRDYAIVEMFLPASYETITATSPVELR